MLSILNIGGFYRVNNKSILFLSSRLPYPPIGGDRLKNYWLLKILSKHFRVHLVSITDRDIPEGFYDWTKQINITFKIFKKNKWQFYKNSMRSVLNRLPIQVNYYYFKDFQKYIDSIYNEYDLLFATLIRTALYVINKDKPKILDMADSIALNYVRSKVKTKSKLWRLIYSIEGKRLLNFESICIDKFNKSLFFNKNEMNFFNRPNKTAFIPHGVNERLLNYEKINPKYKNYIAFFGKMDYQPNIDAVLWFVENILPKLDKDLKFIIVGAYPTKEILNLAKGKDIIVTGFVEDPYEILKSCLCIVAPMQTGGGIQNKILETMALGTINIVSSLAAEPIGGRDGVDYFILDKPEDIVNKIHEIYRSPKNYEFIKTNAREFIRNHFTWSIYEKKLLSIIEEVLNANSFKGTT